MEKAKKNDLGETLIKTVGHPIWNKAIERGKNSKQWFIPFSNDNRTVFAILVIEKSGNGYKYEIISETKITNKRNETDKKKIALLSYFNQYIFGVDLLKTFKTGNGKNIPLAILPINKEPQVAARWEVWETCITTNLNCNCPSSYSQCDLCSQCLRTDCWETWIWIHDETEYVDPPGGGGGGEGGGNGNTGIIGFLSYNLNLTQDRINFLTNNPSLQDELYHYIIDNNTTEAKAIAREHIDRMMNDPSYLQFVAEHLNSGTPNTVWWMDDTWLNVASNFNLDITRANNQYDKLTAQEKALIAVFPVQAYVIKQNVQPAFTMSDSRMGTSGGLNDKKDAFRHAFFQAINTRDVPARLAPTYISGSAIVTLFATAHESEVPSQLNLEKQMDLFNNEVGISYCWNCWTTSNNSIADAIMDKLNNGELKYIKPLNFAFSPYFDANGDGVQDCPTCLNGILSTSILTPTNQ